MRLKNFLQLILLLKFTTLTLSTSAQTFHQFSNIPDAPNGVVLKIVQDKTGFMWFATTVGLYRYDSKAFKKYRHDPNNPNSLVSDYITNLNIDSEGNLWVSTSDGISLLNTNKGTFKNFLHDNKNANSISGSWAFFTIEDSQKNIWVGTVYGLDKIKKMNDEYQINADEKISFNGKAGHAYCMVEGKAGEYWVGTSDGLVYMSDAHTLQDVYKRESTSRYKINEVLTIFKDDSGNLWLGTGSGLIYFNTQTRQSELITEFKHSAYSEPRIKSIVADENGMLWISTESGLAYFNPKTRESQWFRTEPDNPNSLADDVLYSSFLDNQGGLWLGSYYLAVSYMNTKGLRIHHWPAKSNIYVNGRMGNTSSNKLWTVSEDRRKFSYLDINTHSSVSYDLSIQSSIHNSTFYVDNKDHLWCNGEDTLFSYNIKTHQQNVYPLQVKGNSETLKGRLHRLFEDKEGRFWIVGDFGLWKLEKESGEIIDTGVYDYVHNSLEDSNGNLWFGGGDHILYLKKGSSEFEYFPVQRLVPNKVISVWRIAEDPAGRIWFATTQGLQLFDAKKKKLNLYTDKNFPHLEYLNDIQSDRNGYLWIVVNSKLIRYHPEKKTYQVYDQHDGLYHNTRIPASESIKDHQGNLHFSTNRHFFSIDPETILTNEQPSPLVITSLKLFNNEVQLNDETQILKQPIDKVKKLTFQHHHNVFSLEFALLNFHRNDKQQYSYKLDGFEENWNDTQSNTATYTNLAPGNYTFLVKAANGDGYGNEEPLALEIEVLPPWWKTWYAYTLYILLIGALIYSLLRFLWMRKSAQQENELYQNKLDFFTNISHEIRTHLSLIINPIEKVVKSSKASDDILVDLGYARNNSQRLLHLVNELLDFRKIDNTGLRLQVSEQSIEAIITNVLSAFEYSGKEKGIKTTVKFPDQPQNLWLDVLQIQKVFLNLLSNAYKFTPEGGNISITFTQTTQDISVYFTNNGKGIDQKELTKLFSNFYQISDSGNHTGGYGIGLALSRAIVEKHHGNISVTSRKAMNEHDGETTFIVSLLKGNSHFTAEEMTQANPFVLSAPLSTINQNITGDHRNSNKTLLIIEDNDELRAFTKECFKGEYTVLEAANGNEGIELAQSRLPDIIISDIMIPAPDGLEVCQTLKSAPLTCHIPIILLTAKGAHQHITEGLKTGSDDYIVKPFDLQILKLKIHNLIQGREMLKQQYRNSILAEPDEIISNDLNSEFIKNLKDLVIENLSTPEFGVNEIAFHMGVSVSILYRKVRAITDMTVNDFMKTIRMKRAKQLLEAGEYHVNEIAFIVGFEDRRYFSREFRKIYGKTPNEFRKNAGEDMHA